MITAMRDVDFSKVYDENKKLVWSLVSRYASNQQDREDLFQEVFFKIHKGLGKFRGDSSLETWIYRIAVNTAMNHLKKHKRLEAFKDFLAGLKLVERVEEPELPDAAIWKPLEKLNPLQRTVLLLSDVEEKKLEEIASLLKLPIGTVKSNLHRAREIVRKELG